MARLEIDDELVAHTMRVLGLETQREAVECALRRLVDERPAGPTPLSRDEALAMRGSGWEAGGGRRPQR